MNIIWKTTKFSTFSGTLLQPYCSYCCQTSSWKKQFSYSLQQLLHGAHGGHGQAALGVQHFRTEQGVNALPQSEKVKAGSEEKSETGAY